MSERLTYSNYLAVEQLLSLQTARSNPPEHDEQLFIIIHQTYELWFKLMLHEFEKIQRDFEGGDLFHAMHTFKRVRTVMKTLVGQLDILETMTPRSFTSFRDRLESASGFQSHQFREVEFVLGYKRRDVLNPFEPGTAVRAKLEARLAAPTLIDSFYRFLAQRGVVVPGELLGRDVTQSNTASEALQVELVRVEREQPELGLLFAVMCDFDEGMQEWRYRHIKLVERTIGEKTGTGGSTGVEFLKRSLFKPVFADLWALARYS